ncbi:SH3 domain-containing protein [Candidatus Dependentiae bacterium]|nr:SH3 domain-containing protein [Candidatus Dependentiae bacterium]
MQPTPFFGTDPTLLTMLTKTLRLIPMLYLQLMVLALWILLFIYLHKLLKQKKRLLVTLLFALLAAAALILAFKYTIQSRVYLVTTGKKNALYSGPDVNFTVLGHLPANKELIKLQEVGAFVKVRYKGTIVWIEANHVEQKK